MKVYPPSRRGSRSHAKREIARAVPELLYPASKGGRAALQRGGIAPFSGDEPGFNPAAPRVALRIHQPWNCSKNTPTKSLKVSANVTLESVCDQACSDVATLQLEVVRESVGFQQ